MPAAKSWMCERKLETILPFPPWLARFLFASWCVLEKETHNGKRNQAHLCRWT